MFRIAHLTDIHVMPERNAPQGMAAALAHVHALDHKPDAIFLGGDVVMDTMEADKHRAAEQWDVFTKVLGDHTNLPIEHCIGNHDCWGLNREASRTTGEETHYGKRWAMDVLQLRSPFRSFDRAGWHFIVLDSTYPVGTGYVAKLDEPQFEWLAEDLKRTPRTTPVLVLSHIPILSASAYFDGENEKSGDWVVPGAWMHLDARRLKDLFSQHPNVKLCLSGHIHLCDRVDYNNVTYLCNGAVCGNWWNGKFHECEPGYALVDLFEDGTFECEYVHWGWNP